MGYETPAGAKHLPQQVVVFEKLETPFIILSLSIKYCNPWWDDGDLLHPARRTSSGSCTYSPLKEPDTPISDRLPDPTTGGGGVGYQPNGEQIVKDTPYQSFYPTAPRTPQRFRQVPANHR